MTDLGPLFPDEFAEADEPRVSVEGDLPDYVRGTYYLNGPARFGRGELRYGHWLDGDGMVCALQIGSQGTSFKSRYVRTHKLVEEESAGKPLFRTFGTSFPGDRLVRGVALASPANVSVLFWSGRLFACGEQGLPLELDPQTLETQEEVTFGRRLTPVSPFAAHFHIDPRCRELFTFGVSFATREPSLTLYRFDGEGELLQRRRVPLPWAATIHDFALSPSWALFYVSPYVLDVEALIQGEASVQDGLSFDPRRGSRLLAIDRESGELTSEIELEAGYSLHLVNAFEEKRRLMVDLVQYERPLYPEYTVPELYRTVGSGRPVRYVLDQRLELDETRELDYDRAPDFPVLDPARSTLPYDDFWLLGMSRTGREGAKLFDELVHLRWSDGSHRLYRSPAGHVLGGEPALIANPTDPSEAALLLSELEISTGRATFLLFDAFDVESGPVARLPVRSRIHVGFHSFFVSRID